MTGLALVTGAGSGMGRLAARRLSADGTVVVAVDVDEAGLAVTADLAPSITTRLVDVTDTAAVADLVAGVVAEHGPVERLVVAAGIAPTAPLVDQPADVVLRAMDVNFGGVVRVVGQVLPSMRERARGEIVVFASLAGWMPTPMLGAYSASKHAVVAYCDVLGHELAGTGVRLVCVCPGIVDTPMVRQLEDGGVTSHQEVPMLAPSQVLDAVEAGLAAGDLFVFPGLQAKALVRARRFAPNALWKLLGREL